MNNLIPTTYEKLIFEFRSTKVMIDADLATLYGTETKKLKQAVRRNKDRFPTDFMFVLTKEEKMKLVETTPRLVGLKYSSVNPMVFTEQGVAMLSSVLRSKRAIKVNIAIMRTFVKLREMLSTHKKLARRLEQLEKRLMAHDKKIQEIYFAMVKLMEGPEKKRKKKQAIGFTPQKKKRNKK